MRSQNIGHLPRKATAELTKTEVTYTEGIRAEGGASKIVRAQMTASQHPITRSYEFGVCPAGSLSLALAPIPLFGLETLAFLFYFLLSRGLWLGDTVSDVLDFQTILGLLRTMGTFEKLNTVAICNENEISGTRAKCYDLKRYVSVKPR